MRFDEGLQEVLRKVYPVQKYKHLPWETKYRLYNAMHSVDPDIWSNYLESRINQTSIDMVVEDPRYLNEVKMLQRHNFHFIRVTVDLGGTKYVKSLRLNSDKDNLLYYEWYNPTSKNYVAAEYAVHFDRFNFEEDRNAVRRALDQIVGNLREQG